MADKKEIMTPEEIGDKVLSKHALDAYVFALDSNKTEKSDKEMNDFIVERGKLTEAFRELSEVQKWADKLSASLKAALKRVYGEGPEGKLPENVKWAGYQYTYSFTPGAADKIAHDLIAKGETTETKLFEALTVSAMAKAAGVFVEALMTRYPSSISSKAKERVLYIK
jgi:hypothetical protein